MSVLYYFLCLLNNKLANNIMVAFFAFATNNCLYLVSARFPSLLESSLLLARELKANYIDNYIIPTYWCNK